jgi:phosphatidylglycerophosphate synthase
MSIENSSPEKNVFQRISDATNTIVTPANVLDAAAFAVAVDGIRRHDTWSGIAKSGAGYIADMLDGKIARATGTQSPLGEAIDAGGDKLKLAFALTSLWRSERVPRPLLAAVAVQNAANAAIALYDRQINDPPLMHSSNEGKQTFAMQEFGIGLHVIGAKLEESRPSAGRALKAAGNIMGWAGVIRGTIRTTPAYWRTVQDSRTNTVQPLVKPRFPRAAPGY